MPPTILIVPLFALFTLAANAQSQQLQPLPNLRVKLYLRCFLAQRQITWRSIFPK